MMFIQERYENTFEEIAHEIIIATFYHKLTLYLTLLNIFNIFCVILAQRYISHLHETPRDRVFYQSFKSVYK
jgi:hypothetical protein